ncbi:SCO family protein [Consotaella aegiceratis]|uniref:SCO family protein n=1 Tax=Consotaella aegiceratis TaxID=3097961 RepID=UPI002F3F9F98
MKRTAILRYGLWAVVAFLAGAIATIALFYGNGSPVASEEPYGTPFQLVDQNDQPITEQALRGKPTAIFFGYTHCPDVCPTTLYEMAGYQQALRQEGKELQVVFVSVDPERDTPDFLKNYLSALGADIVGITGDPDKVEKMVKGWGIYAEKVPGNDGDYTMNHTASVFLLDREGRLAGTIAYGEDPKVAQQKLERLAS